MIIRGICQKCSKRGWFIRQRQYLVTKVSSKPITTTEKMCNRCAKNLARIIKLT